MVTQKARVYVAGKEKTRHWLRAELTGGPFNGLKVSCPYSLRDNWRPGDQLEVIGKVVSGPGQGDYFKASKVRHV